MKKRGVIQRFGVLFVMSLLASKSWALTATEFFERTSPSVWVVRTYDNEGLSLGLGSAVVVGPETLTTNCHVLRKASRIAITKGNASIGAVLELWDTAHDICRIKASGLQAPAVPLGAVGRLAVGQPVFALGNPKGLESTLSSGLVSSLRRDEDGHLTIIQTSAPISPGSSGGGLFDEEGRLIGITSSELVALGVQNLNFAIPVNYVIELPERHQAALDAKTAKRATNVPVPVPVSIPSPEFPKVAARTLGDRVPYLNDSQQIEFQERFLTAPLPRAIAISDNAHMGYAWGAKTNRPGFSADPKERALQSCAKVAGKACFLYAVDDKVVYVSPPQAE